MQTLKLKKAIYACITLSFFVTTFLVINSCRKEIKLGPFSNSVDSLEAARTWYESTYPVQNNIGINNKTTLGVNNNNGQSDYSQYIKPDWNHNVRYKRFGKDVIEMPVDPSKVFHYALQNSYTGLFTSDKANSMAKFLLFNDGKNIRLI
jgi:hypothetical protein